MPGTTTRRAAAGVLCALAMLPVAGCRATPRVTNGSVSVCYRAIPVGRGALHDRSAKLIGVHRVAVDSVRSRLPAAAQDQLASEDDTTVCEMSFRGTFQAGQVELALPDQAGNYAVVLVSSKKLHLVATVVLKELPRSLGGRTL